MHTHTNMHIEATCRMHELDIQIQTESSSIYDQLFLIIVGIARIESCETKPLPSFKVKICDFSPCNSTKFEFSDTVQICFRAIPKIVPSSQLPIAISDTFLKTKQMYACTRARAHRKMMPIVKKRKSTMCACSI